MYLCRYQRSPVYNQNIKEWTKTIIHNVVVWNKLNLVIGVRKIQQWIALWRNVFSELLFVDMYWKHYNTKTNSILSLNNSQNPTKYKNWTRLSSMHCDISPFFLFSFNFFLHEHTRTNKNLLAFETKNDDAICRTGFWLTPNVFIEITDRIRFCECVIPQLRLWRRFFFGINAC